MFLSAVIPTIGRLSLDKAVNSLLCQRNELNDFEIIVVNDSGNPLSDRDWMGCDIVRVIETNRRGQSVARNSGAGLSRGNILYFLDDDDWASPSAISILRILHANHPDAAVYYGGAQFTDEDERPLGIMNLGLNGSCISEVLSYSAIPMGTAFVRTDYFFKVGGFNAQFRYFEDGDLFRKLSLLGEFVNSQEVIGYILKGNGWQTSTNYVEGFNNFRVSRENILNSPNIWSRLNKSATSPYSKARNLRAYLASVQWNMKNRKFTSMISRAIFSFACLGAAGPAVLDPDFWRGLRDTQPPNSDVKVMGLDKNYQG